MKWQKLQKIMFIVFLILVIVSIILYKIFGENLDITQVNNQLKSFGIWAPIIFIVIYTFGTIFIPSTPFMAIAGIFFDFTYGLIYTIIGGLLSSIVVFAFARKTGQDSVEKLLKNKYAGYLTKYDARLKEGGIFSLIILRIMPIMPFNVLNILMGISKIEIRNYVIGTVLGLIPSNVVTVYFGSFITKLF